MKFYPWSVCINVFAVQGDSPYVWTDGWPVFFTQWGPGEPSNNKDEGCVSMHASHVFHGTWNDTKCDEAKPYICKISKGQFYPLSFACMKKIPVYL